MRPRNGFTLVELLIASFIAALTLSTIFLTLNASIRTFHAGEKSMDLYQSARTGMERLAAEVRLAINPEGFWKRRRNPGAGASTTTLAELVSRRDLPGEVDLEANTITFKGSRANMSFVQIEADSRLSPSYDLREYEFKVNDDHQLVKISTRSVLADQMAAWRAMRFPDEEESYYAAFIADAQYGVEPREYVLTDRVTALHLRYWDGEKWRDSWDSEEIITPEGVAAEEIPYAPGERPVRLGLPLAVEIVLTFEGDKSFYTVSDVPASLLNLIPHEKTGKVISRGGGRYLRDRHRRGSGVVLPSMDIDQPAAVDFSNLPGVGRLIRQPDDGRRSETRYR
ncbi:prepilin-type N-terminal cleavage/methylation domain-containing protein [bacterium]|nr:prepilin-type N-terminal cleavage/methylation domain-containing protein [bacterium]